MKKTLPVLAALTILAAMSMVSGCGSDEEWGLDPDLFGRWQEVNTTYYPNYFVSFYSDGTVELADTERGDYYGFGIWHTAGETVVIKLDKFNYSIQYTYEQVGDVLKLTTVDGYRIECRK